MTRTIAPVLGAAAVALGGLATSWRTGHQPSGTGAAPGFVEVPWVAPVLLGLGVISVIVASRRVPALLGWAAAVFLVAGLLAVGGLGSNGPASWLFVGGCLAAAVFAALATRSPTRLPVLPSLTVHSAENRVRRALSTD